MLGVRMYYLLSHELIDKDLGLPNDETAAVWLPPDNVLAPFLFHAQQKVVELERKRNQNSSAFALDGDKA